MTPEEIERLADEVHALHRRRLDLPIEDLIRRPFKRRPRPKTAIISRAAEEATATRQWLEEEVMPYVQSESTA